MNKGFPSLLWNLYGSDGDQAGAYFGTQEANRPLHALYALDTGTVTVDNLGGRAQSGLSVQARVYSLAGKVLDSQAASGITLASQQVRNRRADPEGAHRRSPPGSTSWSWNCGSTAPSWTATCTGCPPIRT